MKTLSQSKSAIKRREQRASESPLQKAARLLKRKESEARSKKIMMSQFKGVK